MKKSTYKPTSNPQKERDPSPKKQLPLNLCKRRAATPPTQQCSSSSSKLKKNSHSSHVSPMLIQLVADEEPNNNYAADESDPLEVFDNTNLNSNYNGFVISKKTNLDECITLPIPWPGVLKTDELDPLPVESVDLTNIQEELEVQTTFVTTWSSTDRDPLHLDLPNKSTSSTKPCSDYEFSLDAGDTIETSWSINADVDPLSLDVSKPTTSPLVCSVQEYSLDVGAHQTSLSSTTYDDPLSLDVSKPTSSPLVCSVQEYSLDVGAHQTSLSSTTYDDPLSLDVPNKPTSSPISSVQEYLQDMEVIQTSLSSNTDEDELSLEESNKPMPNDRITGTVSPDFEISVFGDDGALLLGIDSSDLGLRSVDVCLNLDLINSANNLKKDFGDYLCEVTGKVLKIREKINQAIPVLEQSVLQTETKLLATDAAKIPTRTEHAQNMTTNGNDASRCQLYKKSKPKSKNEAKELKSVANKSVSLKFDHSLVHKTYSKGKCSNPKSLGDQKNVGVTPPKSPIKSTINFCLKSLTKPLNHVPLNSLNETANTRPLKSYTKPMYLSDHLKSSQNYAIASESKIKNLEKIPELITAKSTVSLCPSASKPILSDTTKLAVKAGNDSTSCSFQKGGLIGVGSKSDIKFRLVPNVIDLFEKPHPSSITTEYPLLPSDHHFMYSDNSSSRKLSNSKQKNGSKDPKDNVQTISLIDPLKVLLSNHGPECSLNCPECNQDKPEELVILRVVPMKSGKRTKFTLVKCEVCSKTLPSKLCFMKHLANHFNLKRFHCSFCNIEFFKKPLMQKHLKLIHDDLSFVNLECEICGKPHTSSSELLTHMKKTHGLAHRLIVEEEDQDEMTEENSPGFNCIKCNETVDTPSELVAHFEMHEREERGSGKESKRFPRDGLLCHWCGLVFNDAHTFGNHSRKHCTDGNNITCVLCCKLFHTEIGLRNHMEVTNHDFRCSICMPNIVFNARNKYRAHMQWHKRQGTSSLQCPICPKKFKTMHGLKRHIKTHTRPFSYKCQFCSRELSSDWALQNHLRVHTGERPYKCEECGMRFNHNVSRRNHIKQRHQDKQKSSKEVTDAGAD